MVIITQLKRFRQYGIGLSGFNPGPLNAITDVCGVKVGHCSVVSGDEVRTGVTAVLPHPGNIFKEKVPAAVEIINGFGKAVGLVQISELGEIETPIILTNTLSVGRALDALVEYKLKRNPDIGLTAPSVNGVVAECNDGYLNDIRGQHIKKEHVWEAIAAASSDLPAEGSVGAGVGMKSFGCKSGIGTSSRLLNDYCLGVLVLSNFGKWEQLKIAGIPVGKMIKNPATKPQSEEKGSIVIIVATDAPLDQQQLKRIARRAGFGLARTGSAAGSYSGDFVIAFSTGFKITKNSNSNASTVLTDYRKLDLLFEAVIEATEEAIINALFCAGKMAGRNGHIVPYLPAKDVIAILKKCYI